MKCVFILGHNPALSVAEILAVLPKIKVIEQSDCFLILENKEFDCQAMMPRLGGTVKIGVIMADKVSKDLIVKDILGGKLERKVRFGVSHYKSKVKSSKLKVDLRFGLEVKRMLKERGVNSRLVTSREPVLSAVVITKNKCQEFMILDDEWLAKTCAMQEFAAYSFRDYGRPVRDVLSGTMPPKLAKIMINLAQFKNDAKILDPFCGSGTILQEAILLGYKNVVGCDISKKAVSDTKKNLEWLFDKSKVQSSKSKVKLKLFKYDVRKLGDVIEHNSIDAIVTEPYLGPPLRGGESLKQIQQIIGELEQLYLAAFTEFQKVLKPGGRVVIIFPVFVYQNQRLKLSMIKKSLSDEASSLSDLEKLGFEKLNQEELIYSRPGQKVEREVLVLEK